MDVFICPGSMASVHPCPCRPREEKPVCLSNWLQEDSRSALLLPSPRPVEERGCPTIFLVGLGEMSMEPWVGRRGHCTALSKEESTVFRRHRASAVGEVSPSVVPHWNWQGREGSRNSRHMSRMAGVGRLCWWVYLCSVSLLVHGTVVYACRGRGRGERCYCECAGVYR